MKTKAQSEMLAEALESSRLRARRREARYKALRQKTAEDILLLMTEQKVSWEQLAEGLGYTPRETKNRVLRIDLRLGQLVEILDALGMELYPIFRRLTEPRRYDEPRRT